MLKQSIAIGVVSNQQQQLLITKRSAGQHLAGHWEFPGGKLNEGESYKMALRRELAEEVGITVATGVKFFETRYEYPDRLLHFQCYKITAFTGAVKSNERQSLRWVDKNELKTVQFPQANRSMVDALTLPQQYMIADEETLTDSIIARVRDQLAQGVRLIQYRADKQMNESLFVSRAREIKSLCAQYQATLVVNCPQEWLAAIEAAHVHLTSCELEECYRERNHQRNWYSKYELFSASCHNEEEVAMANSLGVRCILVGPVNPTQSHPHADVLGWSRFYQLCSLASVPVYALGGMQLGDYQNAVLYGAQGIAGIRAFAG